MDFRYMLFLAAVIFAAIIYAVMDARLTRSVKAKEQAERELATIKANVSGRDRARRSAGWCNEDDHGYTLAGRDNDGQKYVFAELSIYPVGDLFMLHYKIMDTAVPQPDFRSSLVMDGNQFIGDFGWAITVAQRVMISNWTPEITHTSSQVSSKYRCFTHEQRVVTLGNVYDSAWDNDLGISWDMESQRWLLSYYKGSQRRLHTMTYDDPKAVVEATTAAAADIRAGKFPAVLQESSVQA